MFAEPRTPEVQRRALEAMASVLYRRLERARAQADPASASDASDASQVNRRKISDPVFIQLEGPGSGALLDILKRYLIRGKTNGPRPGRLADLAATGDAEVQSERDRAHPAWTVVRFDAWRYQRIAPPWWWLVTSIDRQLRKEFAQRGRSVARRKRLLDYRWRLAHFFEDLVPVVPLVLVAGGLWLISGRLSMGDFVKWAAVLVGGLTTLGAALWSLTNIVRRLFVASPANLGTTLRTSDPMADLRLRYSYLIGSAESAILLIIDNLDRCQADYVVELLEGIQTLLGSGDTDTDERPVVAVVVPAARAWLCDSYLQVYKEFQEAMDEPGRPFGLGFVDRVFDVTLRLPRVAIESSHGRPQSCCQHAAAEMGEATAELEVRKLLADAEREDDNSRFEILPPLRLKAVEQIGLLEVTSDGKLCSDTETHLNELIEHLALEPVVAKHVLTSYCVQRTRQLLGGHRIDDDPHAIHRLGLWAILDHRWPLLSHYLARHPDDIELLRRQQPPRDAPDDVRGVFGNSEAALLVEPWSGIELTPDAVRQFSYPDGIGPRSDSQVFEALTA
jgi:KAP family P-loop domain